MNRFKRITQWTLVSIVLLFFAMILFSPYGKHEGFGYSLVRHTIQIDAPPEEVFTYLGDSRHAMDWSIFVDHINPLNNNEVPDGKPGSRRRCFQNADEKGLQWDELITEVVPNQKRQLTIYNMVGFPLAADDLATEQIYEPIDGGKKTKLTFTLFYLHHQPTLWEQIKTCYAAYTVQSIYRGNLANIKQIVEKEYAAKQH